MKCQILHESRGRIRVHICQKRMSLVQADQLENWFSVQDGVTKVQVFDRTCDMILRYSCDRAENHFHDFAFFVCGRRDSGKYRS